MKRYIRSAEELEKISVEEQLTSMLSLLKDNFKVRFSDEIEYLRSCGLIEVTEHWISLTQKGFRYSRAVGAMFWSERQKQMLVSGNISK